MASPKSSSMGHAFESYVRMLMMREELEARTFDSRPAVGKRHEDYKELKQLTLPKCTAMRLRQNIAQAVLDEPEPGILFHPVSEYFPLIDFCFKAPNNTYYAVQVTNSTTHDANLGKIEALKNELDPFNSHELKLIYAIPYDYINKFVTNPVDVRVVGVTAIVIGIPNPSEGMEERR